MSTSQIFFFLLSLNQRANVPLKQSQCARSDLPEVVKFAIDLFIFDVAAHMSPQGCFAHTTK